MSTTFDRDTDAAYIRASDATIISTVPLNEYIMVDLDAFGATVGVEVLEASSQKELIANIESNFEKGIPLTDPSTIPTIQ
jgi:uncharacterized protein YuzE